MKRSAFTLIELLVVIAVIGLLAGLLFTGVLNLVRQGRNAANRDNAAILSAAIMEYWHDQGRWPIPKGHKPKKVWAKESDKSVRDVDIDGQEIEGSEHQVYQYKLVYGALNKDGKVSKGYGNDAIVQILLSAKVGKLQEDKSYLDLGPFVTCPYEDGTDADAVAYPIDEVVPAGGLEEKAKTGQVKVPLLYRAQFIQCPHCKKIYTKKDDRRTCDDRACKYYEEHHKFYRFKAKERKGNFEGAKPYVITFDFMNNKCDVTMP